MLVRISEHSGEIVINDVIHDIPNTSINIASTGDLVFIRMAISKDVALSVAGAKAFTIYYAAPQSEGFHFGSATLADKDRKSIALAFRNCV